MLLAQKGYRVLVVDRAGFPSDTVSTHMIHAPGVAALRRWGLLDRVVGSGCPPIEIYSFDFGPVTLRGKQRPAADGGSLSYAPRRTVLDTVLVEAAARAGAEVRERFTVEDLIVEDGVVVGIRGHDDGGGSVSERARVVVGADGSNSLVARAVKPEQYNEKPALQGGAYAYFSDLPLDDFEIVIRPDRGYGALPTNDGLSLVVVGWPAGELAAFKSDVEGNFFKTLELSEMGERVRAATRAERFRVVEVPNFFRKPYGPGWALVGDAGYTRDPITAQGICDAFEDAERCAAAVDRWLAGDRTFEQAMAHYHDSRDTRVLPIYEFTTQLATLEPPPPQMQQLIGAMAESQEAIDAFVSVVAGIVSPVEFFDPEHVAKVLRADAPQLTDA
jgi:2-polyprenyl-6-methoxyphenol hydroxylase-like FAD-dependent oxidoreductase